MRCQVVYNDRQRELIRARVKEYYDLHHFGARKMSWGGFCDEILDDTRKHVRFEPLRQWVTGFVAKNRDQPLRPRPEEMEAIVEFLMLPSVGMLLPEELVDSEPPYRFLQSFLEFVNIDADKPVLLPPPPEALNGVYEAWHQVEDPDQIEEKWIRTTLTLERIPNSQNVRATETWEIHFRGTGEAAMFGGSRPSKGWGIVTPEGSLFLVMKTQPNAHNYYYLPVAAGSRFLALLRHDPPQNRQYTHKTFEEVSEDMKGRTLLLNFKRVAKLDVGE
jgi:hypothetical protein